MKRNEAIHYRGTIERAAQLLDDANLLTAPALLPEWTSGADYLPGYKVRWVGSLWRCIQDHTAQPDWTPEKTPALWERLDEIHAGTRENPVPYGCGMALESGKFYSQAGVIYCCIRNTGQPVYHNLKDLVGIYVQIAD